MSNNKSVAYVAIKKFKGGGAVFAYLPNTTISLPKGWEWSVVDSMIVEEDISYWVNRGMSVDDACRMMSADTGVSW